MPLKRAYGLYFAFGLLAAVNCAQSEAIYTRGLAGAFGNFDPQRAFNATERAIDQDIYEGLVIAGPNGQLRPGVAISWQVSANGLSWTFTLRSNATWSNGDPVTAADFVTTFQRLADPATGSEFAHLFRDIHGFVDHLAGLEHPPLRLVQPERQAAAQPLDSGAISDRPDDSIRGTSALAAADPIGVSAPDALTLSFTLDAPIPDLVQRLAHPAASPVHHAQWARYGLQAFTLEHVLANGPFIPTKTASPGHLTLIRNETFHDRSHIALDAVETTAYESGTKCVADFMAGLLDTCAVIDAGQMADVRARFGQQLQVGPSLGAYYLILRTDQPPFDDPRVRLALHLALDREALVADIWGPSMQPILRMVPEGFGPTLNSKPLKLNDRRDAAIKLLAAAGYGPELQPLTVRLATNTGALNLKTMTAVAQQWSSVLNVKVSIISRPAAQHFALLDRGTDFDVARVGWLADVNTPLPYFQLFMGQSPDETPSHYVSAAYNDLMAQALATQESAVQDGILAQAATQLETDVPIIPLLLYQSAVLVSPRLANWYPSRIDSHPARFLRLAK